jgi:hypothetical protein
MERVRSKRERPKKRISPSARTPEMIRENHPLYQYAIQEYAQTVPSGSQNDDGKVISYEESSHTIIQQDEQQQQQQAPLQQQQPSQPSLTPLPPSNVSRTRSGQTVASDILAPGLYHTERVPSHLSAQATVAEPHPWPIFSSASDVPDATYEEHYGDAYVGGPLKYVYPSGYKSMRPRSCPWKLSIIVCLLFTWLSVFIVGHCSDRFDQSQHTQADMDDDSFAIEKQWCGSRLLYLMWVASMLITGLSAAYCSVIGYIQIRDFAVANGRSQVPGIPDVKSDYYVSIDQVSHIYQADGNPQFWAPHIYRPTQAAVAVTSR